MTRADKIRADLERTCDAILMASGNSDSKPFLRGQRVTKRPPRFYRLKLWARYNAVVLWAALISGVFLAGLIAFIGRVGQ